ncbi:hypothetical protein OHA79_41255 [Streptomyces sp. NBC_00841]|uniref:hypothetical protein n=1 Tax=unclassified Streptomyces TaxID=2593676 RepID=UPI0022517C8A|nr:MULTISPECIES: hypothetical protein [unclassified Streptomyces]MCX4530562.1 hypothetical protein [Streptomyces sp. NBC_01669]WSA03684.1 hypothetical protein OHA79_41255 [Streptomyces sp. NBC_00841]
MNENNLSEAAKAVVRRNTEEVQGGGGFALFDELFADGFLDHTLQPGRTPDKAGTRELYQVLAPQERELTKMANDVSLRATSISF